MRKIYWTLVEQKVGGASKSVEIKEIIKRGGEEYDLPPAQHLSSESSHLASKHTSLHSAVTARETNNSTTTIATLLGFILFLVTFKKEWWERKRKRKAG